jgi:RNA ligase
MNYRFPEIRHISDVLPHVEGRDEFVVAEREGYTVVNYVVAMADTFDMTGPDDLAGAIRRECRGLIFDHAGNLMSRPFHKFFNVNEREETQVHKIDLSAPHVIMEKLDGSMIRPLLVDGHLRLATKMGVTEVAMNAEVWLATQDPWKKEWLLDNVLSGTTPLFEWTSRKNQIVIDYAVDDLVYLGSRKNETGEYFFEDMAPFTQVPRYGSVSGNLSDYIARAREQEGREGDIIRFADGHMLKVKNDWYVRIHKTKDIVAVDRNIVELVLNETIDDTRAMLDPSDLVRVDGVEASFWEAFENAAGRLEGLEMLARTIYGADKKRIALEMVPNLINKADGGFIFRLVDGHAIRDLLLDHCKKNIGSTPKYEALMEWMKA